jgi:hypothetical protein
MEYKSNYLHTQCAHSVKHQIILLDLSNARKFLFVKGRALALHELRLKRLKNYDIQQHKVHGHMVAT